MIFSLHIDANSLSELRARAQAALELEGSGATVQAKQNATVESTPAEVVKDAPMEAAKAPAVEANVKKGGKKTAAEPKSEPAETKPAESKANGATATIDELRAVFNDFVTKFGLAKAQDEGPRILERIFGSGVVQMSAVPNDPHKLAEAVAAVKAALAEGQGGLLG
jgi:hypothetical protein